jgi:hypothetical protein
LEAFRTGAFTPPMLLDIPSSFPQANGDTYVPGTTTGASRRSACAPRWPVANIPAVQP